VFKWKKFLKCNWQLLIVHGLLQVFAFVQNHSVISTGEDYTGPVQKKKNSVPDNKNDFFLFVCFLSILWCTLTLETLASKMMKNCFFVTGGNNKVKVSTLHDNCFFFKVSISENNLQPSIKKLLTERKITANKHQHCRSLFPCLAAFVVFSSLFKSG